MKAIETIKQIRKKAKVYLPPAVMMNLTTLINEALAELEQIQSKHKELEVYLFESNQEIARLNTILINKGVEIAELKEQLFGFSESLSCEGCSKYSSGLQPDGIGWANCEDNFQCSIMYENNYTPKESK